jgi:hypothetical protein
MKAPNSRILVKVNMEQKETMLVGGVLLSTATKFDTNYREKSPTIAEVVEGNKYLKPGDVIVCHHNHFYRPSPYQLEDNLFSIPFNKTIFAKVSKKGNLSAICGNVLGQRIPIPTELELPPQHQKKYIDRIMVTDKGWSSFKNGSTIICRPNAPYDIVYNFGGYEKRVTKVSEDMICGILI